MRLYDAVVYTVGAQTDRRLGIPGEDLPGSWAATEFVAWYNGHPDFQHLRFDLSGERAVVIGNGNVAVDVARMLALTAGRDRADRRDRRGDRGDRRLGDPRDRDARPPRAPRRRRSRRPELQELGELAGADVVVDPADLELDPASAAALEDDRATARRNVEILREYATRVPTGKPKTLTLRFCVSPVAILGDGAGSRRSRSCATSSSPTRRAGSTPSRPTRSRCCRAASSCGASATAASRFPASRSTRSTA